MFVIHQVGEKETLYGLSRRYGVTVARVLEFNPTADGGLEVGQILKIPYTPRTRVQTAAGTIHKVQPKETLYAISKMYDVSVDEIKAWNNLKENALSTGQELLIKKGAGASTIRPTEQKSLTGTHTVGAGETLYSISRLYNISVEQLKAWNGIQGSDLKLGQLLVVTQPMYKGDDPNRDKSVVVAPQDQVTQAPIKISETVAGTDEVREAGLAELIEGTEGNRKYLALHRTAKTGSILKVKNELNNREVFVRVAGPLPNTGVNDKLVIKISKSAYDRLGAIDPKFRVEVTYYK
jgi:LysM repeat protein